LQVVVVGLTLQVVLGSNFQQYQFKGGPDSMGAAAAQWDLMGSIIEPLIGNLKAKVLVSHVGP